MNEILKSIAPAIATALGGPLAGVAIKFLADKLGVPAESVTSAVAGMTGDQLIKMKELDLEFKKHLEDNNIKLVLAQTEINLEEAKSSNWFISGWRPYVGWICGTAFGYVGLVEPFLRFVATVIFGYTGAFPVIDTSLTMQVLFGLLGLGALRSLDKKNGVSL